MSIAITGATGQLGRLVIEKLKQKVPASSIIALVRSPEKAASLGVTARAADYDKPATLPAAFAGVETLLLISANEVGKRLPQHRNVIEAASNAGIRHIAYTSLLRADTSPLNLALEHKQTEELIRASGIPFTILRDGWYTENFAGSISGAMKGGVLIGNAGGGRISSATRADYAEAAVAVLTQQGHAGKTYELAGDDSWTLTDLAAELSRQSGKEIPYRNVPEAEHVKVLTGAGIPKALAEMLAGWDTCIAEGALFDDGRQLSRLIGRPTTPLSATVRELLASA